MENLKKQLNNKRREFSKWFTFSILGVLLFYIALIFIIKNIGNQPFALPKNILIFGFVIALYISYLISKTQFNFVTIYRIISISIFLLLTYVSMLLCEISQIIYLFYIPLILMVMLLTTFRKSIYFTFFIIIVCYFIKDISGFLQIALDKNLYHDYSYALHYQEYIMIAVATYFTFLILYYYIEFSKIQNNYIYVNTIESEKKVEPEKFAEVNEEYSNPDNTIQKLLYQKIIDFFETEKPYQKSDFSIKKLADLLDTNTTYISRALNIYGKKNFSTLVNEYRIAQIKDELAKNTHLKFTLEYVYSKAGFTKQPTFNRVFKEQTGVTPSEYLESLNISVDNNNLL
ncbi:helix-turn-helix domain-containing protein [Chryseobacterium ginsengisoli]